MSIIGKQGRGYVVTATPPKTQNYTILGAYILYMPNRVPFLHWFILNMLRLRDPIESQEIDGLGFALAQPITHTAQLLPFVVPDMQPDAAPPYLVQPPPSPNPHNANGWQLYNLVMYQAQIVADNDQDALDILPTIAQDLLDGKKFAEPYSGDPRMDEIHSLLAQRN